MTKLHYSVPYSLRVNLDLLVWREESRSETGRVQILPPGHSHISASQPSQELEKNTTVPNSRF